MTNHILVTSFMISSFDFFQENKKEYVQLYCDYVLNKSVASQFDGFYKGFHKVRFLNSKLFYIKQILVLDLIKKKNMTYKEHL